MTTIKSFLVLCLMAVTFSLGGCNTISGAGEDVQATGDAIEDAADSAKN